MFGKRKQFRVKTNFRVNWNVEGESLKGEGTVSNMSIDGMEMIINRTFKPYKGDVFAIELAVGETIPLPSKRVKLMWSKEILKDGIECVQCGLLFLK